MPVTNVHQELVGKLFVGLVEDNVDPRRIGRIKVRVQSLYDDLPLEQIPWSNPYLTGSSGKKFEIPAIGKIVTIIFSNNLLYSPYYINADHFNINLQNKLNNYSDEEYVNFISLLFDHRTQIYVDDSNLTLDYMMNKITIDNTSINHELKDNNQKLNLGSSNAAQQAILGNHWIDWFDRFVQSLLKPTSLIGNLGAPVLKPEIDSLLIEYQAIKKTFLSNNVNIVDNNEVDKLKRNPNSVSAQHDFIKINNESGNYNQELKNKIINDYQKNTETLSNSIPTKLTHPFDFSDGSGEFPMGESTGDNEEVFIILDRNTNEKRTTTNPNDISSTEEIVTGNLLEEK